MVNETVGPMSVNKLKALFGKARHLTQGEKPRRGAHSRSKSQVSNESQDAAIGQLSNSSQLENRSQLANNDQVIQALSKELASSQAKTQMLEQDHARELSDLKAQLSQQVELRKQISEALVKSQLRLTQAMDASRLGLVDWDLAHGQVYQSNFHAVFGKKELSSDEHIKMLKRIIHPEEYEEVRKHVNDCINGLAVSYQVQYRVSDTGDDWLWVEECGKVVDVDAHGRALRILGTRRNIQSEVFRDEQVRLAKSVVDHTSEGVFVLDPNYQFLSVNPAYEAIIGLAADELVGRRLDELELTPKRAQIYEQIFSEVQAKDLWQGELLEKRHHGDYFPQWTQINAIRDEKGGLKYYAGMVADLSSREAADKKLNYLLNYDDLTKLANRNQFKDQLHRALIRYKDEATPFALVTLDVDRFKQFNDSFGHDASDSLLREIARRLSARVQKVDILARIGGNEFACVVTCSPTFSVEKFAARLFDTVTKTPYVINAQELMLSCSVGVVLVPDHTSDIETLLQYAALTVQKAKFNGGDQVLIFDESLKSFSRQKLEIEQDLRKAILNQELEVYYQPKLDVARERITCCEALIRWNHPTLGLVSPENFVNVAEESSLILELGAYVMRQACLQTKHWQEQGYGQLSIAVNLSPRQVREKELKQTILDILQASDIAPEYLELELTESMIMEDSQGAISTLNALKELGLKISIDDFGTGYSSLSYLRELPVDSLKIDRSFVEEIEHSKSQQAIVKAIIVLGHSLDLKVVVEGVENHEQLRLLSALGCDFIQGYVVEKPLNADEMERCLAAQATGC